MSTIKVYKRINCGKSFSRRLRISNKIPAIIYGKNKKILLIEIYQNDLINQQTKKNFYTEKLILILNEKKIDVKIQEIQRHPFKIKIYHIDFLYI